ncbi:MAG: prephenate dehydratase [Hyphomicrobiales bacterium]
MNKKTNGVIAYQGEPGANSHIACVEMFPDMEPLACPTFEDAFAAIAGGKAGLGMIPIENSLAGRVADIHHLMPESGLYIVGEHFLRVRHQLLAPADATVETVKTVSSHTMALGQCRNIIRDLDIKPIATADTAGAAQEVAAAGDPSRAAIATRLAGEIYGLHVLRDNIEDADHNTTRFLVLSREPDDAEAEDRPVITSFVFRVRNVPAALYKAMGGFATNGVNMTKLESYQLEGSFNATQFYSDIEGHPSERSVRLALEELDFFTTHLRILGVYKASPFREDLSHNEQYYHAD